MKLKLSLLPWCFILLVVFSSCYSKKADKLYPAVATACDTAVVTYSGTIKPIVLQNCTESGCHNAVDQQSGYDMTTYEGLYQATQDGDFRSDLLGTTNPMPKDAARLSDCDLQKIFAWVDMGAPQN